MNVHATETGSRSTCHRNRQEPFDIPFQTKPFEQLPIVTWTLALDGSLLSSNQHWSDLVGARTQEHKYWWDWIDPDQHSQAKETWINSTDTNSKFEMHCRLWNGDAGYQWHLIQVAPASIDLTPQTSPTDVCSVRNGVCTNVQKLYDEFNHFVERARIESDMLNASVDCIKMLDLDGTLRSMNRSGCIALGVPENSKFGMKWADLVPADIKRRIRRAIAVAGTGKQARFSGSTQLPGRSVQHWDSILTPLLDASGTPVSILCVSREITLQRAAEARLRAASERDPLTGLLNRKAFNLKANRWLKKARLSGETLALILIDLDHFKSVNDSYGHPEGDHLIREIAKRIEKTFQNSGLLSRLGGDEFAIILRNIDCDQEVALAYLKKCFAKISAQVLHGGRQINAGMSVGVSFFPRDASELTDWMRKSDVALSDAKANYKGSVRLFDESMSKKNFCSLAQLNAIRSLLNSDSFEATYQRIARLDSALSTDGYVAQLRLKPEVQGMLGFIATEILSANHTIANESAALLRSLVLQELAKSTKRKQTTNPIMVQVPVGELTRDEFAESLLSQIAKHNIAPKLFRIEVRESVFHSRSAELSIKALHKLNQAGIEIYIGDFGEGLTSLQQLATYPINGICVTENLTSKYLKDHKSAAIVRSICQLCQDLRLSVSAQCIDSEELLAALRCAGFNRGTGLCLDE